MISLNGGEERYNDFAVNWNGSVTLLSPQSETRPGLSFNTTTDLNQYLCVSYPSDYQMASAPDASTPNKNFTSADAERETPKDQKVQQSFPSTAQKSSLLTPGPSTPDLKDGGEPESIRPAGKKSLDNLGDGSLFGSPTISLHSTTSSHYESGPSTTRSQIAVTRRTLRTRIVASEPSNDLLSKTSAPLSNANSAVVLGVQHYSRPPTFVMDADLFSYERELAMGGYRTGSTSLEHRSMPSSGTIKQEREVFYESNNIPRIVIAESTSIFVDPRYPMGVEDVKPRLDLEQDLAEEKPSSAKCMRSRSGKLDAAKGQAKVAPSTAEMNTSPLNYDSLAQKLGIDLRVTEPKCHGRSKSKKCGYKCNNPISVSNWKHVLKLMKRLSDLDPLTNSKGRAEELKMLACLSLCQGRHQDQATRMAEAWEKSLSGIDQRINDSNLPDNVVQTHASTLPIRPNVQLRRNSVAESVLELSTKCQPDFNFSPQRSPGVEIIIRSLVPYDPKLRDKTDEMNLLKDVIRKDLSPTEIKSKDGYIYIYWFPSNCGFIKIGKTTRTVEKRLLEWTNQCGHEPIILYPILEEDQRRVPHVHRVEAIVQAELRRSRRLELRCGKCFKKHREWFEKSETAAIAAVRKWSAWMRKEPYEPTGQLKEAHKQDLQNLCKAALDAQDRTASTHLIPGNGRSRSRGIDSHFRSHSEQPRRRSSRLADQRKRLS